MTKRTNLYDINIYINAKVVRLDNQKVGKLLKVWHDDDNCI